jgi:hypothetical protein
MNYTSQSQMIRIAGFSLFLGAAALMAQSPSSNNQESAKEPGAVQLVASIATTTQRHPVATESLQSQPQAPSSSKPTEFVQPASTSAAQTATSPAVALVNPTLMPSTLIPGTFRLAMVKEHTAPSQPSWFTAGPEAIPAAVRMDPSFGPPTSKYGAAPMAVQFTFGRK